MFCLLGLLGHSQAEFSFFFTPSAFKRHRHCIWGFTKPFHVKSRHSNLSGGAVCIPACIQPLFTPLRPVLIFKPPLFPWPSELYPISRSTQHLEDSLPLSLHSLRNIHRFPLSELCPLPLFIVFTMENLEQINKLEGGLRHLRLRDANAQSKYAVPVEFVRRPGFNPTGKEIEVQMNSYRVTSFPTKTVYQYSVSTDTLGIT